MSRGRNRQWPFTAYGNLVFFFTLGAALAYLVTRW